MRVFYSDEPLIIQRTVPCIFLAGPTPRSKDVPSWRPEALRILESLGYTGQVCVPERRTVVLADYNDQVEWEDLGLRQSTIAFWVPRKKWTMPALTTNVEFGRFYQRLDCIYGRPDDADHIRYLDWLYTKDNHNRPIYNTLEDTLRAAANYHLTPSFNMSKARSA